MEAVIDIQFEKPCPGCGKPPTTPGKQANIYVNENDKTMAIKCMHCNTLLDMLMTEEQFNQVWESIKAFKVPIN